MEVDSYGHHQAGLGKRSEPMQLNGGRESK